MGCREVNATLRESLVDSLANPRVVMTQQHRTEATVKVNVAIAVNVLDVRALGASHEDRMWAVQSALSIDTPRHYLLRLFEHRLRIGVRDRPFVGGQEVLEGHGTYFPSMTTTLGP